MLAASGWHWLAAGHKAHEVERTASAWHLNLSIEAAHGHRAVVALKQPHFHVLFGTHIWLSAFDQGVEMRRILLGENWV